MPRDRDRYESDEDRRRRRKDRDRDRDRDRGESSSKRDRKKDSKHRSHRDDRERRRKDSDSEDDRKRKSHRDDRDRHHKRKKRRRDDDSESSYERRKRKKDKKSKKSSRKHDKDDEKKVKKPDKSKLVPMGDSRGSPPETLIDAEKDYFSFHNEFWIYLFREEGVCFNDLETPDARKAFGRFAKDYNEGKLEEPYYTRNFPNDVIQESKTTKHSWGFKTTTAELKGLGDMQQGIRKLTEYNNKKEEPTDVRKISNIASQQPYCAPVESLQSKRPTVQERKRETKKWRETVKLTHEELSGGPKDFRERQLEKKRSESAKIHGAHKDREAAMELDDSALYGDGGIAQAKARLQKSKERRNERQNSRIQELQKKEEDRKNNMLKMLGLENLQGKKLEIAPRK